MVGKMHKQRHNKALYPTDYSSVRCSSCAFKDQLPGRPQTVSVMARDSRLVMEVVL